jgi:2-polyprenyl-3-methyl-5-hydroxy-6-metoxy-1,4-benzoquinol methylase
MSSSNTWSHRLRVLNRIVSKRIYRFFGNRNLRWQPHSFYSIKAGYHHSISAEDFDDTPNKDEWQRSVYELALSKAGTMDNPSILDIGCGSAYKLINMFSHYHTTGVEVEPTYSWLQQQYPGKEWVLFDDAVPAALKGDLVICSDVIEHIANPDDLMEFLEDIPFRYLVISTPERDLVAGKEDFGPPANTAHFREWNGAEFRNYLRRWFTLEEHLVLDDKSVTQVAICSKTVER